MRGRFAGAFPKSILYKYNISWILGFSRVCVCFPCSGFPVPGFPAPAARFWRGAGGFSAPFQGAGNPKKYRKNQKALFYPCPKVNKVNKVKFFLYFSLYIYIYRKKPAKNENNSLSSLYRNLQLTYNRKCAMIWGCQGGLNDESLCIHQSQHC